MTTNETGDEAANDSPRRAPRRRRWWMLAAVVIVAWLVIAAVMSLQAKGQADRGLADIEKVGRRATGGLDQLVTSLRPSEEVDITALLRSATSEFRSASDRLQSAVLSPALALPYVGRQLRSARALSAAATTVAGATGDAYRSLEGLLTTRTADPAKRLAAGRAAERVLRTLHSRISGLDLGPNVALLGRLGTARRRFSSEYEQLGGTTERALTAVTGLNQFLTGPTSYVLLASNNGEMRAGSGMYLQVGLLTVTEGRFEITDIAPTRGLALPQPGATLDPDVAKNWGWLQPNQEWRNLNLTPRYDESARMATEMWATQHPPVQGALNLDVAGLKALLDVVGSIEVPGKIVTAQNVERYLLRDQYQDFADDVDVRPLRDERLAQVAKAALEAFNTKSWSPSDLMTSMLRAGSTRHLMLWSSLPKEQAGWRAVGASGEIPSDGLMLSSLNRSGNKIDQFLAIDADITVDRSKGAPHVRVVVQIKNNTPNGLPRYVQGPYRPDEEVAGQYIGIVQLTMPGAAWDMTMSGGAAVIYGKDGPSQVMGTQLSLLRGQSATVTFDFLLPGGTTSMVQLPSARIPATTWSVMDRGETFTDARSHVITFR